MSREPEKVLEALEPSERDEVVDELRVLANRAATVRKGSELLTLADDVLTRKGSKWLRSALTESARAAARSKGTYLAAHYARLRGRRGSKKAAVAVGHSILVICYHVLERGVPYEELGEDYFDQQRSGERYTKRLVRQLERLGHKVALEPLPQSA